MIKKSNLEEVLEPLHDEITSLAKLWNQLEHSSEDLYGKIIGEIKRTSLCSKFESNIQLKSLLDDHDPEDGRSYVRSVVEDVMLHFLENPL